jgi:hypothetical protein
MRGERFITESHRAHYQITRYEKGKRVAIIEGNVGVTQRWIWKNRLKRGWFNDPTYHYFQNKKDENEIKSLSETLDPKKKWKRIVKYDYDHPEPLAYDKVTKAWALSPWNQEIENEMINKIQKQNIEVSSMNVFMFDPQTITYMLILLAIGFLVGIPLNALFGFLPNTIVHWVP